MKKLAALVLVAAMSLCMVACGGSTSTASSTSDKATTEAASEAAGTEAAAPEAESTITEQLCETPIILTSIGQSSDVDIVDTLCDKIELDVYKNATITADELTDQYKTIIFAVGGSSKGLGAAGIDADQELERTTALIEKAQSLGIKIVAMHTGGTSRRGTLSDSFIDPAFNAADVAIVVSEGDSDGFIKTIIDAKGIPYAYCEKASDVRDPLKTIFGLE